MRIHVTPVTRSGSPKFRKSLMLVHDVPLPLSDRLMIPAGFEFDGASIPPVLWPIIGSPFDPRFQRAALVHDWLYSTHLWPRESADGMFRDLLLQDGVGETRAGLMHRAVRMGGRSSWQDSDEDIAYLAYLRQRIAADGRDLKDYGL